MTQTCLVRNCDRVRQLWFHFGICVQQTPIITDLFTLEMNRMNLGLSVIDNVLNITVLVGLYRKTGLYF